MLRTARRAGYDATQAHLPFPLLQRRGKGLPQQRLRELRSQHDRTRREDAMTDNPWGRYRSTQQFLAELDDEDRGPIADDDDLGAVDLDDEPIAGDLGRRTSPGTTSPGYDEPGIDHEH